MFETCYRCILALPVGKLNFPNYEGAHGIAELGSIKPRIIILGDNLYLFAFKTDESRNKKDTVVWRLYLLDRIWHETTFAAPGYCSDALQVTIDRKGICKTWNLVNLNRNRNSRSICEFSFSF